MTEPTLDDLPRPELCRYCSTCTVCKESDHRSQCEPDSFDCHEQRALWDSGYAAGVKRAEAAESKLAELVRDVREWRAERFGPAILDAILDKHDKPEGGA